MNLIVQTTSPTATTGQLMCNIGTFDCTLGRTGVTHDKTEGDGKTPIGIFPLQYLLWRSDRAPQPETGLPTYELKPDTGWCEDPAEADYNRQVVLPHTGACDTMTRDDHLYDYTVIIGYNDDPVIPGKGSAIFMHLAREDFTPTAGCVGLKRDDLLKVLKHLTPASTITILPPPG